RITRLVARGAGARELADAAAEEGYRPMWEAGLVRVRGGETTEAELARVLTPPWAALPPPAAAP
ncbi:MAG TPA: hypothetical protein VFZ11_04875, partial [Gemmatimonadaceae bacterium]